MKGGEILFVLAILAYVVLEGFQRPEKFYIQGEDDGDDDAPDAPIVGCTDPFAENWNPQAELYGDPNATSGIVDAMNTMVCQYQSPSIYEEENTVTNIQTGLELITDKMEMRFVCFNPDDPERATVRKFEFKEGVYDGSFRDEQMNPDFACFENEYLLGHFYEPWAILANERAGLFEETEYSTGDAFTMSISKVQVNEPYDFDFLVDNLRFKWNPNDADQMTTFANMPPNAGIYSADADTNARGETFSFGQLMDERRVAINRGEWDYHDPIYGGLMRVGDPSKGNSFDLDIDKNAMISWGQGPGYNYFTAFSEINTGIYTTQQDLGFGQDSWEDGYPTTFGIRPVIYEQMNFDKSGVTSVWEYAIRKGQGFASNSSFILVGNNPTWRPQFEGYLGYDGIACENPETDESACFALSERDKEILEFRKRAFDAKSGDYVVRQKNFEVDSQTWQFQLCVARKADEAYDEFYATEGGNYTEENYHATLYAMQLCREEFGEYPGELGDYFFATSIGNMNTPVETVATRNLAEGDPVPPAIYEGAINDATRNLEYPFPRGNFYGSLPGTNFFVNDYDVAGTEYEPTVLGPSFVGSMPLDFGNNWDGVARNSCPASHPEFIRFCQTGRTSDADIVRDAIELSTDMKPLNFMTWKGFKNWVLFVYGIDPRRDHPFCSFPHVFSDKTWDAVMEPEFNSLVSIPEDQPRAVPYVSAVDVGIWLKSSFGIDSPWDQYGQIVIPYNDIKDAQLQICNNAQ